MPTCSELEGQESGAEYDEGSQQGDLVQKRCVKKGFVMNEEVLAARVWNRT